jgi:transcriptional regulator with XRE-family HTH domain
MSIGSDLKQARESRKISLETVSQKTKIPVKYLESIEEGRFEVFPSHTYAKGFIRAYAKIVGMDAQVLTRQFNAESKPEEVRVAPMSAEADLEKNLGWRPTLDRPPVFRRPVDDPDLSLEMAGDLPEESARRDSSVMRRRALNLRGEKWMKWARPALAALAFFFLAGGAAYFGVKAVRHLKWILSKPPSSAAASPDSIPVADKYQHLVLKALDKSWVLVTMDDGQSSSELDMDPGEVKTYKAAKNFKLKLGNAGGMDVQFNGRSLGVLGTQGQVVEITLPPGADQAPEDSKTDANETTKD